VTRGTRTLVVAVADWPLVAAGVPSAEPAAVLFANRVVATSAAARANGVTAGLRRREAQARCPELTVLDHDPARDARAFEPVAAALDTLTPRIEIAVPGRCAFPTRGPSRYHGGDHALAGLARQLARAAVPGAAVTVGVADGLFAAHRAADHDLVVDPGGAPAFLAPLPLHTLDRPELVDVLHRLGVRTLGELAALPAADVLARFGTDGALAHRLASGGDERSPATRPPPPELAVSTELDPPAERVDVAAFAVRGLADELHRRLNAQGLACTRVLIAAETEHGERLERLWRHEGALTAAAIADRARWQLDGWLSGSAAVRPTSGVTAVWLVPDEVGPATGRQLGFWGADAGADERAVRALARLEGLLGPEAVRVPERRGGRGPGEQVVLVPAAAVDITETRDLFGARDGAPPWPGRLPGPAPASVLGEHGREPVEVVDREGRAVGVSGRGVATADPAKLRLGDGRWQAIAVWAGPWPVEERWWDPALVRRRARFQVVTADGAAHLLAVEDGRWWREASYD
jgi:protein ImuB